MKSLAATAENRVDRPAGFLAAPIAPTGAESCRRIDPRGFPRPASAAYLHSLRLRSGGGGSNLWNPNARDRGPSSPAIALISRVGVSAPVPRQPNPADYRISLRALPRTPAKTRFFLQTPANAAETHNIALTPEKDRLFGGWAGCFMDPEVEGSSPFSHPFPSYRRTNPRHLPAAW